jgi:tyrosyl-tRNA synthetase
VMTGPILEGLDAKRVDGKIEGNKMSKSLDNYVGVSESPDQMFGKLMSITDDLMWRYYELLSSRSIAELASLKGGHPKEAKVAFAREMVARFHDAAAADRAVEDFEKRFAKKDLDSSALPEVTVSLEGAATMPVFKLLASAQLAKSSTEARTLLKQGAVRVNQEKIADEKAALGAGEYLVQVGKLKAARVKLG